MSKVKLGLIGCGSIANRHHLPCYMENEDVEIVYFCDIIPERAQKAAETYGSGKAVVDYKEVLADPEVEAVDICTPNKMHSIISIDALKAGKHVLCEKPAAINYEEALKMQQAQKESGKILNIGVVNRFEGRINLIKKYIEEGRLGEVYHVYASFRAHRSIPGIGGAFTTKAQSGGGVLIDWGIHYLDLILYILGGATLKNLTCDAYSEMAKDMKSYKYKGMWAEDTKDVENGTNDVDDMITGYVRTDKATISFNGAWAQNIAQSDTYIDFMGDKAGARLAYGGQYTFTDGSTLESYTSDHEIPNMYLREDSDFIEAIKTGTKNRNNIDNILESMKLLDRLYASAAIHKEIEL